MSCKWLKSVSRIDPKSPRRIDPKSACRIELARVEVEAPGWNMESSLRRDAPASIIRRLSLSGCFTGRHWKALTNASLNFLFIKQYVMGLQQADAYDNRWNSDLINGVMCCAALRASNIIHVLMMYTGVQHIKNSSTTANNIFITRTLFCLIFWGLVCRIRWMRRLFLASGGLPVVSVELWEEILTLESLLCSSRSSKVR